MLAGRNACGTYPLHTWNPSLLEILCNCIKTVPQVSVKKSEFFSVITKASDRMPIVMTIDVTMSFGRLEGLDSQP